MNLTCPWRSYVKILTSKSLRLMKGPRSSRLILQGDLLLTSHQRGLHPTARSPCHLLTREVCHLLIGKVLQHVEMMILKAD
eukprot:scaffold113_cov73-Skeletonema_marinoi.AAC.2